MKNLYYLTIIVFLFTPILVFAEKPEAIDESKVEADEADSMVNSKVESQEESREESGEESEISSLYEDRQATLKYGIDNEVIELIKKLIDEENEDFAEEILEIFSNASNPGIIESSVDYLIKIKNGKAIDIANQILSDYENQETNILSSALRYVSEFHDDKSEELILPLVKNENTLLASSAIRALGKCGTAKSADKFIDFLDEDEFEDSLKPEVIKALGEMKSEEAIDILADILDDTDEEKSWRWIACEALGKIGNVDALPEIKNALTDDDLYLRSYAVKALANFDEPEVEEILIQSLRDSFWKVRVSAAEALGEKKSSNAIDILIYKAEKDPENNVRIAALESLGQIGTIKSYDFLRSIYKKSSTAPSLKKKAAMILIENDLENSIDTINEIISEEWEKEKSSLLSYTCKFLSTDKNPNLESIFEKMLDSESMEIKIYGIRGIGNNGFSSLKEKIKEFDDEKVNLSVRKAALDALKKL